MTVAQGTGAGLGAVLGGILAQSLQTYAGFAIDLPTATGIVVALMSGLGLLAHAIDVYGFAGIWRRLLHGRQA